MTHLLFWGHECLLPITLTKLKFDSKFETVNVVEINENQGTKPKNHGRLMYLEKDTQTRHPWIVLKANKARFWKINKVNPVYHYNNITEGLDCILKQILFRQSLYLYDSVATTNILGI